MKSKILTDLTEIKIPEHLKKDHFAVLLEPKPHHQICVLVPVDLLPMMMIMHEIDPETFGNTIYHMHQQTRSYTQEEMNEMSSDSTYIN
jgi:hypothetical protein